VRTSALFGWTSHNFVRTMLRLGAERDEVSVVADQCTAPTFVGHLAAELPQVLELPFGVYHVAASGECTWAGFARAIFEEAGLSCRVREISSSDWNARALRPAYSVLRSEKPARRACRTGGVACGLSRAPGLGGQARASSAPRGRFDDRGALLQRTPPRSCSPVPADVSARHPRTELSRPPPSLAPQPEESSR
jgi:hypothetical protein